jgi:L-alanine-DL-glutamate epimerase-like enolase superfamily enzyme
MRIMHAETMVVEVPFSFPGSGHGIMPSAWRSLEFALVRLDDDEGNTGWGEGFGYFTVDATKALIDRLLLPGLVGHEVADIPSWNTTAQRQLNVFGRNGPAMFAISAVDIALWDLAAKRAGKPLAQLLRPEPSGPPDLRCYASMMRYERPQLAVTACEQALARGFSSIKLHEIDIDVIAACRAVLGSSVPLSVDVNCAWSADVLAHERARLEELGLSWLEEPIFPPEDFAGLRELRSSGLPIAAGENWSPAFQFHLANGSVDILQPSVTKVGGISQYLEVLALARAASTRVIPHCPYFGPGLLATMHLAAASEMPLLLEFLYVDPDAWLFDVPSLRRGDRLFLPDGAGLGFTPDSTTMARYRRA